MSNYSRDRDALERGDDRARRRHLDYLLDRDPGTRSRPASRATDRDYYVVEERSSSRSKPPQGLRVSEPESFERPCETEVRGMTGDSHRCGAPAREYRVYMNNTWQRWVICSTHAAYYRSWGADLSVLVD